MKLIDATSNDLQLINDLMRRSKAYWNYDTDFMNKFMSIFRVTKNYLEQNNVKLFFGNELDCNPNTTLTGFYSLAKIAQNALKSIIFLLTQTLLAKAMVKKCGSSCLIILKHLTQKALLCGVIPLPKSFTKKWGAKRLE